MSNNKLQKIHFNCQKVLPTVYDDSLSYYEQVCKLAKNLNDLANSPRLLPIPTTDDSGKSVVVNDGGTGYELSFRGGGGGTSDLLWRPTVSEDGELSWEQSASDTPPEPVNIMGPQGPKGDTGPAGADGNDGQTPDITIGTVSTLPAGSDATAQITGKTPNLTLNLGIPKGADGEGETWETIADITTAEEVSLIAIEKDTEQNDFSLVAAEILVIIVNTLSNTEENALVLSTNLNTSVSGGRNSAAKRMFRVSSSGSTACTYNLFAHSESIRGFVNNIANTNSNIGGYYNGSWNTITAFYFGGGVFGVGSRILVRGVRA